MLHNASDFFSLQFTFSQVSQSLSRACKGTQCEAHGSWVDEVAAVEGQPNVNMISGLWSLFGRLFRLFPSVGRCGLIDLLSRIHGCC